MDQFDEKRTEQNTNVGPLLERAFMFLEDKDWNSADKYCERVLDIDPKCADAYLGKLMAELRVNKREKLKDCMIPFDGSSNYQKAIRFANDGLKAELTGCIAHINTRNENERLEGIYTQAKNAMAAASTGKALKVAAQIFETIPEYKNAAALAKECYEKAEIAHKEAEGKAKRNKKIAITVAIAMCMVAVVVAVVFTLVIPAVNYNKAMELLGEGKKQEALLAFGKSGLYKYATSQSRALWNELAMRDTISAGDVHTVGLKADGTVVATKITDKFYESGQCDVSGWTDIVAISAGYGHTVGLKADGTVVATKCTGDYYSGECNVSKWTDIVAISTGFLHTVGLKANGTVVAVGRNDVGQCNVNDWTDIVAISAGSHHTVGLKADGTVVATKITDKFYENGQCDVSGWTNIKTK